MGHTTLLFESRLNRAYTEYEKRRPDLTVSMHYATGRWIVSSSYVDGTQKKLYYIICPLLSILI